MFIPDYHTDIVWMHRLSYKWDRFKAVGHSNRVFNARCPICGDSQKSRKARFYFYTTPSGTLNVNCKNCNYHHTFFNFMKYDNQDEFKEYKIDQLQSSFKYGASPVQHDIKKQQEPVKTYESNVPVLKGVVPILSLDNNHVAVQYLKSRAFSDTEMERLLWADNFKITADSISLEPLSDAFPEEPRIVIPFYNEHGDVDMIQGRSVDSNSAMRYISIKKSDDIDKIYGKYEVDKSKTTYCVEGPFDSLFVDNCYASCDSGLTRVDADVYIWDCECRNMEIIQLMSDAISRGKKLVIWPASFEHKVDINDMIKMGLSRNDLMEIIKDNTYSGIQAKLKFDQWRRV